MPGDEFYIKAFFDLSTERQLGMNVGPIPWSNILAYASYSGLEADMIDVFIYTIREMDAAYLNRIAEKQKKAEELKRGNNKHG